MQNRFIGIHYPSVEAAMNMQQIPHKKRRDLFNDLKIMERAALEVMNQQKDN